MSIYLGSNELQRLNIGGTQINEVYLGDQKIWPKVITVPPPNYAKTGWAGPAGIAWGQGNPLDPLSVDEDILTLGRTDCGLFGSGEVASRVYTRHPDPASLLPPNKYVQFIESYWRGGFFKYSFGNNDDVYSVRTRVYGSTDGGVTPGGTYVGTSAYRTFATNWRESDAYYNPHSLTPTFVYNPDPAVTDILRQGANFIRFETSAGSLNPTSWFNVYETILNIGWSEVLPPTTMGYEMTVGRGRVSIQPGTSWSFTEYGFMSGQPSGPGKQGNMEVTIPGSILTAENFPLKQTEDDPNFGPTQHAIIAEVKCLWSTSNDNAYLMVHIWSDAALGQLSSGYPFSINVNGRTLTSTSSFSDSVISDSSASIAGRAYRQVLWSGNKTSWAVPWPDLFAANAKIPVTITRL